MLVPKRFEKPSKDGSQNQTMELETELENRVHPLFGFKEPYSNRFWNPNNLLGNCFSARLKNSSHDFHPCLNKTSMLYFLVVYCVLLFMQITQ